MISTTDYNLIAFKAICTFTHELSETFGAKNHSLKLYDRLLVKTSLSHDVAIKKHLDSFRKFCVDNRDGLMEKDIKKMTLFQVEYSPKVFIDFNSIFPNADKEAMAVIWKHLLTISALLDPSGNAKEILKSNKGNESDFLTGIINKVESHVKPDSNPMEAVSSIMSSGVFTELITDMNTGIQDGSLDLQKLMGTVQNMCSTLNGKQSTGEEEESNPTNNLLGGILNNLKGGGGGEGGESKIDMSQIMNMMGPMLSAMGSKPVQNPVDSSTE